MKEKQEYCVDCNGEAPVRLENCPAYKAKIRQKEENKKEEKEEKK